MDKNLNTQRLTTSGRTPMQCWSQTITRTRWRFWFTDGKLDGQEIANLVSSLVIGDKMNYILCHVSITLNTFGPRKVMSGFSQSDGKGKGKSRRPTNKKVRGEVSLFMDIQQRNTQPVCFLM